MLVIVFTPVGKKNRGVEMEEWRRRSGAAEIKMADVFILFLPSEALLGSESVCSALPNTSEHLPKGSSPTRNLWLWERAASECQSSSERLCVCREPRLFQIIPDYSILSPTSLKACLTSTRLSFWQPDKSIKASKGGAGPKRTQVERLREAGRGETFRIRA